MSRNTGTSIRPHQGPWRTTDCTAYYFLLDADHDRLQQVVDAGLNSTGERRFEVTVDAVAMTFQQFQNMRIVAAGDTSPVLNYPETAFFVMVSDKQQGGRIYIWTPFMYCGDTMATISGREVFGFPKEFSQIFLDGKRFSVQASGLTLPAAVGNTPSALSIVKGGVANLLIEHTQNQLFRSIDLNRIRQDRQLETVSAFWAHLGGFESNLGQWVNMLINPAISFIFNRSQYVPETGQWQTKLLQSQSPINQFTFDEFLVPLDFEIADTSSHPIVSQLGLITGAAGSGTVNPLFACKISLDFSLNPPQLI